MPLLTVDQVAERLGSGYDTVRRLIESHELKSVNISTKKRKVYRIDEKDLEKFIKRGGVI